ncbi:hypothetical protein SLNWT_3210 [Streptomyces albus]|uniref:Uncharacterized protein n=1 Tax=Streptomyces albus (strain ATCC 21838 / DSM 41398 / FERM P-419 / JCM 4703 / NBRC 107858) TaxID=1081613 RepID=A0A0B5EY77_STRA4|nr:hypothetical protein SLNWT_3210 [Streptomyces albus]
MSVFGGQEEEAISLIRRGLRQQLRHRVQLRADHGPERRPPNIVFSSAVLSKHRADPVRSTHVSTSGARSMCHPRTQLSGRSPVVPLGGTL